jgi:hypothetical protein
MRHPPKIWGYTFMVVGSGLAVIGPLLTWGTLSAEPATERGFENAGVTAALRRVGSGTASGIHFNNAVGVGAKVILMTGIVALNVLLVLSIAKETRHRRMIAVMVGVSGLIIVNIALAATIWIATFQQHRVEVSIYSPAVPADEGNLYLVNQRSSPGVGVLLALGSGNFIGVGEC